MTTGLLLALLTLLSPTVQQDISHDQPNFSAIADRMAQDLEANHKGISAPKILVAEIGWDRGEVSVGGEQLADLIAAALSAKFGDGAVLDQRLLRRSLWHQNISPEVMRQKDIARWVAWEQGANLVVVGSYALAGPKLTLTMEMLRVSDEKKISESSTESAISPEWQKQLQERLPWPPGLPVAVPCGGVPVGEAKPGFVAPGVTIPKGTVMNYPPYTDEAKRLHVEGTVKLALEIDDKGIPIAATVLKGLPAGLDRRSQETALQWRFDPAVKDGKPVPVCVITEMTFHLMGAR